MIFSTVGVSAVGMLPTVDVPTFVESILLLLLSKMLLSSRLEFAKIRPMFVLFVY